MTVMLNLQNLSIGYEGKEIISKINATVNSGDLIGIIGPNGAGKSTLLKTIMGILPQIAGAIKIKDKDLSAYNNRDFARTVAYLQQNVNINFGYTAGEIVLAGRYPYKKWWQQDNLQDEKLAEQCLRYTGTEDLKNIPLNRVSGGQRQRVLLAKVLAQQTPILLLDEPTTGLDIVYQEEIFRFAQDICAMGKTVLTVVHDLPLAARFCKRLWLLGDGVLLADDEPEKVLQGGLLSRAYGAPLKVMKHTDGSWTVTAEDVQGKAKQELLRSICCREEEDENISC